MTADPRRGRALGLMDRRSERDTLDRLIEAVRAGESQALVLRGDPGMGKTMLLDHLAGRASGAGCRVARAVGVQSEMELAFAGVHQMCAPMLGHAERLPVPQRDALRTAFGIAAGPPPDRFFVGLAVLSLLSEVAGERPLVWRSTMSSGWTGRRRRRWGLWRAAWAPTRSGWCSRPAGQAPSWVGCRNSSWTGWGTLTLGRCWRQRWPGHWTSGCGT